jgi:hypothetical protein
VTVEAVRELIPLDSALIEFTVFRPFDPKKVSDEYGEPHYAAYVIRGQVPPRRTDLGPARRIDDTIRNFREALGNPKRGDVKHEDTNPLLRSGLALAGANLRSDLHSEGILTASEVSSLNLWGTKLVTLSACQTGVGEVKNGEGVYGLRRAVFMAGAETLVMSLWAVSDAVTREMMTGYYGGLKEGLGRGDALRRARLAMLGRKNRQHPFYWASFIQAGEWANLEGQR